MTYRAVLWHTEEGHVTAIVGPAGRKNLPVVTIGCPIRLRKVALIESSYMRDLPGPTVKHVRTYRRIAKVSGITKGAKKLLKEALHALKAEARAPAEEATGDARAAA